MGESNLPRGGRAALTARETRELGVRMHGVTLNLQSDHPGLMAYAAQHLDGLTKPPAPVPDLKVRCHWSRGKWNPRANPFPSRDDFDVVGRHMLRRPDELVWLDTLRARGLQLRFLRKEDRFEFDVSYCLSPTRERVSRFSDYEHHKFFSLMKYMAYFPLFWYFERFRNWSVLHGSAVATPKGAAIVSGTAGVGKTTIAVALMKHGMDLVSENVVFTDGEFVYPCCEPVRIDQSTLALLGTRPEQLVRIEVPAGVSEKGLFHLRAAAPDRVEPAVLLLPQFSPRRYLVRLDPRVAAVKLAAITRLTRELDDYARYSAALALHWPELEDPARDSRLYRLTRRVRCFELGVDRSAGVDAVVEDVIAALG